MIWVVVPVYRNAENVSTSDSVFNFTDLPVRLLFRIGFWGTLSSIFAGEVMLVRKLTSPISVPGYTAMVLIIVFFGALNCLLPQQHRRLRLADARKHEGASELLGHDADDL